MTSSYLALSTGSLHYLDSGGSGHPLVFIHGTSQSSECFNPIFELLQLQGYRVVAPDLPGHGGSDEAQDPELTYSFRGYSGVLAEFADKLELKDALWLGHSLGGHILMAAWRILPNPAGMVLCGTAPISGLAAFPQAYKLDMDTYPMYSPFTDKGTARAILEFLGRPGQPVDPILMEINLKAHPQMRQILGVSIMTNPPADEISLLRSLTVPVLIVNGTEDASLHHDYLDRLDFPSLWKGRTQKIDDAAHFPFRDSPNEFADRLIKFAGEAF